MYRCEANNVSAFIRQLAVGYVCRGYFFYVQGRIPEGKDPTKTDEKIIGQYGIAQSKWAKARGRKRGEASIQYLRHGREFVILATHGGHRFFTDEARQIRDVRREPIKYGGYSVGYWQGFEQGHVSVRIESRRFQELKNYFRQRAGDASAEDLIQEFTALRFLPFAPVRYQLMKLGNQINRVRKLAGKEPVPLGSMLPTYPQKRLSGSVQKGSAVG